MNTARLSCKIWQEQMAVRCILRVGQRETTLQRRRNTKEQLGWAEELINAQPSSSIFRNLTVLSSSVLFRCPAVTVFCLLSLTWKMPSQHPQHLQQQRIQEICAIITSFNEQGRDAVPKVSFWTSTRPTGKEMTNQGMPNHHCPSQSGNCSAPQNPLPGLYKVQIQLRWSTSMQNSSSLLPEAYQQANLSFVPQATSAHTAAHKVKED